MKNGFGDYHPLANLIFFASVIAVCMVTDDPLVIGVSLTGAFAYAFLLKGRRRVMGMLKAVGFMVVFTALLNPMFNHAGITPLFRLPWGNAVTLEAVLFGIGAGVKLAAVVMWFYSFNAIVTSDKITYIFGRISPCFALILSLILTFVPVMKNRFMVCFEAQAQFGAGRLMTASKSLLATAGWAIEEAADTAQSMHGRGFGLKGRTSFHLFVMEKKDRAFIAVCVALFIFTAVLYFKGAFDFYYYPYVKSFGGYLRPVGALTYIFMCFMPIGIWFKERRRGK
ncbi:MAG: hypothetical protein E7235_02185 [Lachnospiraceae bacterium]|nr:hypothetical protein [Lachnospiraceae bacterium]